MNLLGVREVSISKVVIDYKLYPRVKIDESVVNHYAELIKEGVVFPPIKVVEKNGKYIILDGVHRYLAYKKAGFDKIRVEVYEIPEKDWFYYASLWNAEHGK